LDAMDNVRDSPPEREGKQNIFDIDDSLKGRAALARLVFSTQILSTLGVSRFRSAARGAPASAVRLGLTLGAPGQDGAPPQLSGLRRTVDGVGLPRAVPQLRRAAIRENLPASADVARSIKRWSNGSDSARCSPVKLLPRIARGVVRSLPFRDLRHRLFLRSSAATSARGGGLPSQPASKAVADNVATNVATSVLRMARTPAGNTEGTTQEPGCNGRHHLR